MEKSHSTKLWMYPAVSTSLKIRQMIPRWNDNTEDLNLHTDRIKAARGPFLDVTGTGTKLLVKLTNSAGPSKYYFDLVVTQKPEIEPRTEVCARCRTALNSSRNFSLFRKAGHLSMVILCRK